MSRTARGLESILSVQPTMKAAADATRAASLSAAQQAANAMLQAQQQAMLETIFSTAQLKQLDKWIAGQNDPALDRSEAIRRLVELGLKVKKVIAVE